MIILCPKNIVFNIDQNRQHSQNKTITYINSKAQKQIWSIMLNTTNDINIKE